MSNWESNFMKISPDDFTSICRICLARNNLRHLKELEYLVDVLQSLTNKEVAEDDGLPQNICIKCIKKLEDISDFIDLYKYNDYCLREVYLTKSEINTNAINWLSNSMDKTETNINNKQNSETIEENNTNIQIKCNNPKQCNKIYTGVEANAHDKEPDAPYKGHLLKSKYYLNIRCDLGNENNTKEVYSIPQKKHQADDHLRTRREQNRIAAAKCRKKFQDRMVHLSKIVESLEEENSLLLNQRKELERQRDKLIKIISMYKCSKNHLKREN